MIRLGRVAANSSVTRDYILRGPNASRRCLSVKALSWCSPSDSPVRRARATEQAEKLEETDPLPQPIDRFGIVAAMSKNRVIGINGGLPWSIPKEKMLFKSLTKQRILIVGRKSFEDETNLQNVRHTKWCIVISKSMESLEEVDSTLAPDTELKLARSFPEALGIAKEICDTIGEIDDDTLQCWVGGGEKIFEEALQHKSASELHLSCIHMEIDLVKEQAVARFPSKYRWDRNYVEESRTDFSGDEASASFTYVAYRRKRKY